MSHYGPDLAGLPLEVSGTPLPGCTPPWWLSAAEMRASHARCVSPEEALDVGRGVRVALVCPCVHHAGEEVPIPERPPLGPNVRAVAPWVASMRAYPSYRGRDLEWGK